MQQTPDRPDPTAPDHAGEAKGRPDNSRERTEDQLEKGMPPNQKRGPQDKSDTRPIPDNSPQDR